MEVLWTMAKEKNQSIQNSFASPWLIGFILCDGHLLSCWIPNFSITLLKCVGRENRQINTIWLANIWKKSHFVTHMQRRIAKIDQDKSLHNLNTI